MSLSSSPSSTTEQSNLPNGNSVVSADEVRSKFAERQVMSFLRNQHNKQMVKDAYKHCDPFAAELATCTKDRTLSVLWACADQRDSFKQCLNAYNLSHAWVPPKEVPDPKAAAEADPLRKKK